MSTPEQLELYNKKQKFILESLVQEIITMDLSVDEITELIQNQLGDSSFAVSRFSAEIILLLIEKGNLREEKNDPNKISINT